MRNPPTSGEATSQANTSLSRPTSSQAPSSSADFLKSADFPKQYRLLTPKQFSYVFADAQRFANRHWTLIVRANQQSSPRLGLAIAKKQLARAVWRNRVKRIAREAFRQHKTDLSGYDIVVLGRRGMHEVESAMLHQSFVHLIRKIRQSGLKDRPVKSSTSSAQ